MSRIPFIVFGLLSLALTVYFALRLIDAISGPRYQLVEASDDASAMLLDTRTGCIREVERYDAKSPKKRLTVLRGSEADCAK